MGFFFVKVMTCCVSLTEKSPTAFWCYSRLVNLCWRDFVCELSFHLLCNDQVPFFDGKTRVSWVICTCPSADQLNFRLDEWFSSLLDLICLNCWFFLLFFHRCRIICTKYKSLTLVSRFVISAENETLTWSSLCLFLGSRGALISTWRLGNFAWYWNYLGVLEPALFLRWLRCCHCYWG